MDAITERKHRLKRGLVFPFEIKKGPVSKKRAFGKIIEEKRIIGYTFSRHATKGWRQMSPQRVAAQFRMHGMGYGHVHGGRHV